MEIKIFYCRNDIRDSLFEIGHPELQKRLWESCGGNGPSSFRLCLESFEEGATLKPGPLGELIGLWIRNEQEQHLIENIRDEFIRVRRAAGHGLPDEAFLSSPRWPSIVKIAQEAANLFIKND